MSENKTTGVPTLMLLPARPYKFTVSEEEHTITIPRRGKYTEIDSQFFTEEDGEFDILAEAKEEGIESILYLPSISKVLFATAQYPALGKDQAFTPMAIIVREEEIDIIGNVIQMLREGESENVQ